MKLIIGLIILLLVIVVATRYSSNNFQDIPSFFTKTSTVTINNQTFNVYLASSDKDRMVGLSEKTSIPKDYGMLFEFEKPEYYSFWMKNMKFPIDIIFIKDNKIVTIYPHAQPPSSSDQTLPILKPDEPADKVLEINAGLSEKYNIKKGDQVQIKK